VKKIICVFLSLVLLVSCASVAFAEGYDGAVPVSVRYYSGHDDLSHDFETVFSYSDSCFTKSAYVYRQDLAEASLGMAFGAFSSRDSEDQVEEDQNWISIMKQMGFDDPASNEWYRQVPQHNSIGVCCANKSLSVDGTDYTLIAVGIRGNYYRHEWGGNMNVGASGDHAGWTLCRDQVLEYVKSYIADNGISGNVKLWMAGYSRSAATANLVAAELDEGYVLSDSIVLTPDNIYCYCFECPLPTVDENSRAAVYGNIQNFINENDVVTCVPFSSWGFTRYGVDRVVPTDGESNYEPLRDAMLLDFNEIPNNGGSYMVDDFYYLRYDTSTLQFVKDYGVSQKEYYAMLGKALATDFAYSREDYVKNLQYYLTEIMGVIFNRNNLDLEGAVLTFCEKLAENYELIMAAATSHIGNSYLATYLVIEGLLFDSLNEADITQFKATEIYDCLTVLISRLSSMAINEPEVTATLLANAKAIISAHYAELCMAWARTLPADYMTSKDPSGAAADDADTADAGTDDTSPDTAQDSGSVSVIYKVITTVKTTVHGWWRSFTRLFR